jgi:diphosphomevalonate decarboxylase
MMETSATCIAHPNIALIKYWGNRDGRLRLPSNGSISMTLGGLETRTSVHFDTSLSSDQLSIGGRSRSGVALERVSRHLGIIRDMSGLDAYARVVSVSDFPERAGIASSAAAFAALTMAGLGAAGLSLAPEAASRLARRGSGSAARSVYGGFVELLAGETDEECFAIPLASAEHWNLVDVIALLDPGHKPTGSTAGHKLADTSPIQPARVADAPRRLDLCREAIRRRDFAALTGIVEQDSNLMHAVMLTSSPPLIYWLPHTVLIMRSVRDWRRQGMDVCYTIDAGPNVHCLCSAADAAEVESQLRGLIPGLETVRATPGGPPRLI